MNVLGLLLALVFGALLSSCQQIHFLGLSADHEQKTDDVHRAIAGLYDRFTYGTQENRCLAIGAPQPEDLEDCLYGITIVKGRDGKGFYQGKFSMRTCEQNMRSGNPFEKCDDKHWHPAIHLFQVDTQSELGAMNDYDLYSQPGSGVLTCHDQKGQKTKACDKRTKDFDPVP